MRFSLDILRVSSVIDNRTNNATLVLTTGRELAFTDLASDKDLLTAFFLDCRYRLRPATLKCYNERLYLLLTLAHNLKKPLAAIMPEDVKAYLIELSNTQLAVETINGRIRVFRVFYNYIYNEELIPENPMIRIKLLPKQIKRVPILSPDQLDLFLRHWSDKTFVHKRNRCVTLVLLDAMIRVGELVSISLREVDLVGGTIYIPHTKTYRDRTVPISIRTAKAIHRYLVKYRRQVPGQWLFPNVDGTQQQAINVSRTFCRASHKIGFKVYPHLLRHTGATHCINAGMSDGVCQRILGHSTVRTTIDIYHHPDGAAIKQQHDKFSVVSKLHSA